MNESIYGSHLPRMQQLLSEVRSDIDALRARERGATGEDPVEHVKTRIKDEESMRRKCQLRGYPVNEESALFRIHDAVGVRIVCSFVQDVYDFRDRLLTLEGYEVVLQKDYIRHPKPNGYRSLHLVMRRYGYFVEFQLRTISMDTWAALEHHMRYKKRIGSDVSLISSELKRCADELASTDLSLQTIRNMLAEI